MSEDDFDFGLGDQEELNNLLGIKGEKMSTWKLIVSSGGFVELELTAIPSAEEKKQIEDAIAPDGFIVAQFFKKIKTLGEYVKDVTQQVSPVQTRPNPAPTSAQEYRPAYVPVQATTPAKKEYGLCPKCERQTVTKGISGKEGKNKGRAFKSCFNKKDREGRELPKLEQGQNWQPGYACDYFEWM